MAKKIKCGCGAEAELATSKGKHGVPFIRCPSCGPIVGRKKTFIARLQAEAYDVDEKPPEPEKKPESESDSGAGHQSDSQSDTPPVKKSFFSDWGTLL